MQAGKLRHRVQLQRPGKTRDELGGVIPGGMEDVATVWASVEPLRGREWAAGRLNGVEADYRVRMRFRSDVSHDWQIVWISKGRKRVLQVYGDPINIGGYGRELEIMCKWLNPASSD